MSRQVERPPRRWRARAVGALIGSALLMGVASAAYADHLPGGKTHTPSTPDSALPVTPYILDEPDNEGGNVSCSELGLNSLSERVNYNEGSFDGPFPGIDVQTDGTNVSWTSDAGIVVRAVIVKGSDDANVYEYNPPAATSDSGLAPPPNASGEPAGLSNLTFCGDRLPKIVVKKYVKGLAEEEESPLFDFVIDGDTENPVQLGDNGKHSFYGQAGEGVTIEEIVDPDYTLLKASCRNVNAREEILLPLNENGAAPSNPQVIEEVSYGDKWICVFVNGKTPKLIVDKVVTGGEGDTTKFDFTLTGEFPLPEVKEPIPVDAPVLPTIDPVAFQLANGESNTLPLRAPECVYLNGLLSDTETQGIYQKCYPLSAMYELTELPVPEGYEFDKLVCSREDPWFREVNDEVGAEFLPPLTEQDLQPVINGPVANFGYIDYGTVVRCTYTNVKLPKLTVTKVLTNGSGDGLTTPFPFSITGQPDFSLTGGQSNGPRILPVGAYTVGEGTVPAGFTFTSASCTKPGTANGQAITLDLAAGDDVTCTFTNNQTPPPPPPPPPPPVTPPPAVITQVLTPRLAIVKTGPLRARPLQRFNYTIRVRNPGRAVARNVVITDRLPSGLIYVRSSRRATVRGRTITIPMGNLRPGQARAVRITVRAAANVRGRKVNVAIARATNVRPVRDTAPTVFRPVVRRIIPAVTG